ncbi:MAG: DUF4013 domain-containing protein [Thermomicrobium sp.]|nr:DUF4013 domain-containing protein [Thermomicrobium sp.]MDW8059217.1 DUF4013 domain-containing protein [Thermomicrobium sp.]
MDLGRAFTYPFQDPQWVKKLAIALVMLIIPIVGWLILFGYMLTIARRVALQQEPVLPEWDDFGAYLSLGARGALVYVVWILPVLILSGCVQPFLEFLASSDSRSSVPVAFGVLSFCVGCLAFLLSLLLSYVLPLPLSRLAVTDRIGSAFAFGDIVQEVRLVATDLLLVLFISAIIAPFIALLGFLLCVVGVLATILYAYLLQVHLWGQVRHKLLASPDLPAPVAG